VELLVLLEPPELLLGLVPLLELLLDVELPLEPVPPECPLELEPLELELLLEPGAAPVTTVATPE
jgi:hypothetical protein